MEEHFETLSVAGPLTLLRSTALDLNTVRYIRFGRFQENHFTTAAVVWHDGSRLDLDELDTDALYDLLHAENGSE